jgi:hypothetical protein
MRFGRPFRTLGNYETFANADQHRRDDHNCHGRVRRPRPAPTRTSFNPGRLGLIRPAATRLPRTCSCVEKGSPVTDIVHTLQLRNPLFTGNGAAKFTALAAGEYCPKYLTGEGQPPKPSGAQGN